VPSSWSRSLPAAALAAGACVSLVLAPQAGYLADRADLVPPIGLIAVNLFYALLVAALWTAARSTVRPRLGLEPVVPGTRHLLVAVPLLLLWWPALAGAPTAAFRVWVPLAVGAATLLELQLVWRRRPFRLDPEWVRATVGGSTAFAVSLALAAARPEEGGPPPLLALLWAAYLLAALSGLGALLDRLVLPGRSLDWGLRAALGLAVAVAVGGVANLTWSVSPTLVLALLAVGAGGLAADAPWRRLAQAWGPRLAPEGAVRSLLPLLSLAAVAALALVQLLASVAGTVETVVANPPFDLHDDLEAYLVFPMKMLDLGSLGPEPFEARRMLSLGGQSFLQTLVLAALPLRSLHLLDAGISLVILLGLAWGGARRRGLEGWAIGLLLLLVLALPHLDMRGNTSSLLTGAVFLLAWYRLGSDAGLDRGPRAAVALALVGAALAVTKSTLIPAAVGFFVASSTALVVRDQNRRGAAREVAATALLVGVLVLPWMASLLASSGTLLYPFLGRGFYGGVYNGDFAGVRGDFALGPADLAGALVAVLVRLLPAIVLPLFLRDRSPRAPALALTAAALLEAVLLVAAGDPNLSRALARYLFPVGSAVSLGLLLAAFDPAERSERGRVGVAAVAGVVVGLTLLIARPDRIERLYRQVAVNATAAIDRADLVGPPARAAARELEACIPAGSPVLATHASPFLLDPRRQPVMVMSLPGMSSPPPGLPVRSGAEAMAEYLVGHGIRHLAYGGVAELRDLFTLTEDRLLTAYPRSKMRWIMLDYHRLYRQGVLQLAAHRKRLYADRTTVLLDLGRRVVTVVPSERPQDVEGFRDGVWTSGEGVVRNLGPTRACSWLALHTRGWHPLHADPDRLAVEVLADGEPLTPAGPFHHGFLFRVEPPRDHIDTLVVRSRAIPPASVGAAPAGPPLGLDVASVELAPDRESAILATRGRRQPLAGELAPETVWERAGFYGDFGWTNGSALLTSLAWEVPAGSRHLVVTLHPVHPHRASPGRLGVRVLVNGVELEPDAAAGDELRFGLYRDLQQVEEVRVLSSTFVPRELTGNPDDRTLGVPIRSLRFE